jgi:hypothetical protein
MRHLGISRAQISIPGFPDEMYLTELSEGDRSETGCVLIRSQAVENQGIAVEPIEVFNVTFIGVPPKLGRSGDRLFVP